jgi:hypothetical protein
MLTQIIVCGVIGLPNNNISSTSGDQQDVIVTYGGVNLLSMFF